MGDTDYLSLLEGPTSTGFGATLYDFGYQPGSLPPAQASSTASQVESGGSGINWSGLSSGIGNLMQDVTKAWINVQNYKKGSEVPTGYAVNGQGQVYAVDPAYRPTTLGSAVGGIPMSFILIGGLIWAAMALGKDD
jgi:hypothetical protein